MIFAKRRAGFAAAVATTAIAIVAPGATASTIAPIAPIAYPAGSATCPSSSGIVNLELSPCQPPPCSRSWCYAQ